MSVDSTAPSTVLLDNVAHWLIKRALAGADLDEIVGGFCERLAAAGLPLARIHLTFSMLHLTCVTGCFRNTRHAYAA